MTKKTKMLKIMKIVKNVKKKCGKCSQNHENDEKQYTMTKKRKNATYLFESVRKKPYSGQRNKKNNAKIYREAGIEHSISPHKLRHFYLLG